MGCLGETITVDGSRENGQNIAILFSIWKYINTISFINQFIYVQIQFTQIFLGDGYGHFSAILAFTNKMTDFYV